MNESFTSFADGLQRQVDVAELLAVEGFQNSALNLVNVRARVTEFRIF